MSDELGEDVLANADEGRTAENLSDSGGADPAQPGMVILAVELFVLSAFAIAQPLLELFGSNGTFLVAHGLVGWSLLRFTLLLVVGPPAILFGLVWAASVVASRVGRLLHHLILGGLTSLIVGPALNRALGTDGATWLLVLVILAVAGAALFEMVPVASTVVHYAAFAPPLFLIAFLGFSPASDLLRSNEPEALVALHASETPVVWLVFDELPLATLVGPDGEIVSDRYPNFARLADIATWYPNAVTISSDTRLTMTSTLTGKFADVDRLPIASVYPTSLFTLMGGSHSVLAQETVTQLCPTSVCGDRSPRGTDVSVWKDTVVVYTRSVLPDSVSDRLVPAIGDRWAGFGDKGVDEFAIDPSAEAGSFEEILESALDDLGQDQRVRFQAFLDSLGTADGPGLYYLHLLAPHLPLRYLGGGQSYQNENLLWILTSPDQWHADQLVMDQVIQRMVMQVEYVDREIGRMLDRLEELGILDDSLVIVMSDHGESLIPGTTRKAVNEVTVHDVLPVPMFVKFPAQAQGRIDDRIAQQIDLLPTVLDVLGIDLAGLELDGDSLLGPADNRTFGVTSRGADELTLEPSVLRSPTVRRISEILPDTSNPYRLGANGRFVGQSVNGSVSGVSAGAAATIKTKDQLSDVDPSGQFLPVHVIGELKGRGSPTSVAVALNGTVAGVGRTYDANGSWRITVMADPDLLLEGPNTIQLFEIVGDGLWEIPIE